MEYNKREEKLVSGQSNLELGFFYSNSHKQEHSICSVLLSLISKSNKKTLEIFTFTYYLNLEKL